VVDPVQIEVFSSHQPLSRTATRDTTLDLGCLAGGVGPRDVRSSAAIEHPDHRVFALDEHRAPPEHARTFKS
jgi:hypothetical protein